MFERFTPDARAIVVDSQAQARALGHKTVGTEHLLLALAEAKQDLPSAVLNELGISAERVREQVVARLGAAAPPVGPEQPVPWTYPAKKTLELSLRQMLERSDPDIGSEHILLASALVPGGGSREILSECCVEFDELERSVNARTSQ